MPVLGLFEQTACSAWTAMFSKRGYVWSSAHHNITGTPAPASVSVSLWLLRRPWRGVLLAFLGLLVSFLRDVSAIGDNFLFLFPCPSRTQAKICCQYDNHKVKWPDKHFFEQLILDFLKHLTILFSRWEVLYT